MVKFVKVQWSNHSEDEATWEREDRLRQDYPDFIFHELVLKLLPPHPTFFKKFILLDTLYVYTITIKNKLGMSYHATPPMPCASFLRCLSCLGEYGLPTLEALSFSIYQISGRDFLKGRRIVTTQKLKPHG
jgi:hypothetical protein